MKTYAVILHIDVEEGEGSPSKWLWDDLIGDGLHQVTVYDVTDEAIERLRISAEDVEEV